MSARNIPGAGRAAACWAAFVIVCLFWGSNFLAIRWAIETIPPFIMIGSRFVLAGALLYALARLRGIARPTPTNWLAAAWVGGFMIMGGAGGVAWGESEGRVPSGLMPYYCAKNCAQ